MPSLSAPQMTFNFEPSLVDRYGSLREYIAHRVTIQTKPAKTIAGDMDMAPSTLSRKLNPGEGDTSRFNLDDLEAYLSSTKDAEAVIGYLAAKYMDTPDVRRARVLQSVESMLPELLGAIASLRAVQ